MVAGDGTKIGANASKHASMSYAHVLKLEAQLDKEITELLAKAEKAEHDNSQLAMRLSVQNEVDLHKDLLVRIIQLGRESEKPSIYDKNRCIRHSQVKLRQGVRSRVGCRSAVDSALGLCQD